MPIEAAIPMPLQIVIDDVGWRTGRDGSLENQPYRTGIDRNHGVEDYLAVISLGRRLGMAPQAAMILSEWDTRNLLRRVPSTSWMGDAWDNSPIVGAWIDECAQIIRDNRQHFECAIHGVGHEFWGEDGKMTRAEWNDHRNEPRPVDTIRAKLELFLELHDQHQLGRRPRAFVPCGFTCHFGREGDNLQQELSRYGITSMSSPFWAMSRTYRPQYNSFGFDHDVLVVDRGYDPCDWNVIDPDWRIPPTWPILGMHWPNLLHMDPSRNDEVIDRWVKLLEPWGRRFRQTLSPNTDAFLVQYVYYKTATVKITGDEIVIDATESFSVPWKHRPPAPLKVKVRGMPSGLQLQDAVAGKVVESRQEFGENGPVQVIQIPLTAERASARLSASVGGG